MILPILDEELIAFMGGDMEEIRSAEIEAAINADPALADRAEALAERMHGSGEQDELVRAAFSPILDAPIPEAITAAVDIEPKGAEILSFAAAKAKKSNAPQRSSTWAWPQFGAMAASLAIGLIAGPALLGGGGSGDASGALVVASANGATVPGALGAVLDTAASGDSVELASLGTAKVDISFRNLDQNLCRQVNVTDGGSSSDILACREGSTWRVEAYGQRAGDVTEVRTASGEASPAVLAAVDSMIDSDPLVGGEEEAALRR